MSWLRLPICVGDGAGEVVVAEVEAGELGEVADLCGDGAGEVVVAEVEAGELGEVADLCGDGAGEVVVVQVEAGELGEVADLCGDGAGEVVVAEVEAGNAPVLGGDALPLIERLVGVPIGVVSPIGASGGVVEGDECLAFGEVDAGGCFSGGGF